MGKGIDIARASAPEHAQMLDEIKDQLLIVLFSRLGPHVEISIDELDGTGNRMVAMRLDLDNKVFHFDVLTNQEIPN